VVGLVRNNQLDLSFPVDAMIFRALKLSCLAVGLFAVASVAQAQPMPGGLNVQQAGTTIVSGATTLNFSSGCTVTSSGIGTASAACTGGGATGVSSFNTRTGAITFTNGDLTSVLSSADIIAALGYTPDNPASSAITGGTINGASIGATTPSTGVFTTLSASSTVSGAGFTSLLSPYAPLANPTFTGTVTIPSGASISGYAPLASPSFTGTATAVNMAVTGNLFQSQSSSSVTSSTGVTFSVAQFTTGLITRSAQSAAVTDTTPTASAIIAAISGLPNSSTYPETITNNNTSNAETLAQGTGVTINGTAVVQPGSSNTYIVNVNAGAGTVTMQFQSASVLPTGGTFSGQVFGTNFSGGIVQLSTGGSPAAMHAGLYSSSTNILDFDTNDTFAGLIDANQHWRIGGTGTPTIASGACGTGTNGTIAANGNDQGFEVLIGSAATTSCVITFASAFTTAPRAAQLTAADSAALPGSAGDYVSGLTTTTLTITGTALANANIYVQVQ